MLSMNGRMKIWSASFSVMVKKNFRKELRVKLKKQDSNAPIETTAELAELIKVSIPAATRRTGGHPAKRVFQAIRIAVNDELGAAEDSLVDAITLLNPGGRISVITFHSLEDRLCKTIFKEASSLPELPPNLPVITRRHGAYIKASDSKTNCTG